MLIHIVHIMEQIRALSFPSITHFIVYLLSVDAPKLQMLTADLKTEEGTQLILQALSLHGSHETIVSWAVKLSCAWFKNEIIRASNVESSLHFNASNACTDDILKFDLTKIASTFEWTAPSLWEVVQALLDSNQMACRQKIPKGATCYEQRHEEVDDVGNIVESEDDQELSKDDEMVNEQPWKSRRVQHSATDRISSLLQIKGCIILSIIANSTNSCCNAFQAIQGFFLESMNAPEHIINVLAHGGWSVSVTSIVNMVKALTKEQKSILR